MHMHSASTAANLLRANLLFFGTAVCVMRPALADDYVFVDSFESRDCSAALTCPVPASGKTCISGQLVDAGTTAPLRARFNLGLTCGGGAVGGPCDLTVAAHDAVAFVANPSTSTPLPSIETTIDGCGRFRFASLQMPNSGFVAIAVDDAPGNDTYAMSATTVHPAANQRFDGVDVIALQHATDSAWTTSAGAPFGTSTFADVGSILLTFSIGGVPTTGVSVIRNGTPIAASDYYFSDSSPQRLSIDSAASATGANGSALVASATTFATYSGSGGESSGCNWPSLMMSSAAGVVIFAEFVCQ